MAVSHALSVKPGSLVTINVQAAPSGPVFWELSPSEWIALSGVFIAVAAAVVAWLSYQTSKREARLAHVNGLFREMLMMEFEYHNNLPAGAEERKQSYYRVMSHKMWVLEELWTWLQEFRSWTQRPWFFETRRRAHHEIAADWEETIAHHIRVRDDWHLTHFFGIAEGCYAEGFKAFVSKKREEKKAVLEKAKS